MTIKVLYIQVAPGGGSMIALYEMVKHLDRKSIEPVILCYYKNKFTQYLENIEACKVVYLFKNLKAPEEIASSASYGKIIDNFILQINAVKRILFYERKIAKEILQIIRSERPDLIHQNNDLVLSRAAIRAARKAGIKQIIHNRSLAGYGNNFFSFLYDLFLIRNVSFRIDITNIVSAHVNKLFYLSTRNCAVIPDIIDLSRFKPGRHNNSNSLKNEFGIKENQFVIACIGRLIKWKGQHVLIEAMRLLDGNDRFKVLLIGPDDKGVGSKHYAEELKSLVSSSGLQEQIFFAGNRSDIPEIINISDVVVHASIKPEPQGMVILEALLCKKPVIASDAGGAAELIKKYGGFLVKPNDAQALANAIVNLLQNDHSEAFPSNYEKLKQDLNVNAQTCSIMDIYKKVKKTFNYTNEVSVNMLETEA